MSRKPLKQSTKQKDALPTTEVVPDHLGIFPVSGIGLSFLNKDQCNSLIGYKDDPGTLQLKEKGSVQIPAGKKTKSLKVAGQIFNGFADAFYRGKLPQVILVLSTREELTDFTEEVLEYLEQMVSLGFFLKKSDPVELLMPNFVLVNQGIFYEAFINNLQRCLRNIPHLDAATHSDILAKFIRGSFENDAALIHQQSDTPAVDTLVDSLGILKLAGLQLGNVMTVQSNLSLHNLVASMESSGDNPPLRLELETAYRQMAQTVLPAWKKQNKANKASVEKMQTQLKDLLFAIGRQAGAFEELEKDLAFTGKPPKEAELPVATNDLESHLLTTLARYAQEHDLGKKSTCLKELGVHTA
ncbi:MAG: hypothetical protein KTR14_03570 [Vampirovibrio sp.]|nr:hypothetical protein [Vampirovibrio sp.]